MQPRNADLETARQGGPSKPEPDGHEGHGARATSLPAMMIHAVASSAPLGDQELRRGPLVRLLLFVLGLLMLMFGMMFGIVLAGAALSGKQGSWVAAVSSLVFILIGLYGLDVILRGAIRSAPLKGVFEGRLGLARAIGGSLLFSVISAAT